MTKLPDSVSLLITRDVGSGGIVSRNPFKLILIYLGVSGSVQLESIIVKINRLYCENDSENLFIATISIHLVIPSDTLIVPVTLATLED